LGRDFEWTTSDYRRFQSCLEMGLHGIHSE
jgi:hypothetical protein